ncbi:MAG TPA: hypothetical protein VKQ27_08750 [Acetobacteraceae bacterium]|nr:hypothetical protein [Acetobacteraceae bacterium]
MTSADEIARGLSKAQREKIIRSDVIVLRNRWDTRIAINLAKIGVCERGRHINQFELTPLGLEVREILRSPRADTPGLAREIRAADYALLPALPSEEAKG